MVRIGHLVACFIENIFPCSTTLVGRLRNEVTFRIVLGSASPFLHRRTILVQSRLSESMFRQRNRQTVFADRSRNLVTRFIEYGRKMRSTLGSLDDRRSVGIEFGPSGFRQMRNDNDGAIWQGLCSGWFRLADPLHNTCTIRVQFRWSPCAFLARRGGGIVEHGHVEFGHRAIGRRGRKNRARDRRLGGIRRDRVLLLRTGNNDLWIFAQYRHWWSAVSLGFTQDITHTAFAKKSFL